MTRGIGCAPLWPPEDGAEVPEWRSYGCDSLARRCGSSKSFPKMYVSTCH